MTGQMYFDDQLSQQVLFPNSTPLHVPHVYHPELRSSHRCIMYQILWQQFEAAGQHFGKPCVFLGCLSALALLQADKVMRVAQEFLEEAIES
jgi:hypothetical protein